MRDMAFPSETGGLPNIYRRRTAIFVALQYIAYIIGS